MKEKNPANPFSSDEKRALLGIASIYGIRMIGLFMLLPVLTIFAPKYTGATPVLVGICLGAYGITQAMLQIPFGLLSDRIGRKTVITIGLSLFFLGSIVAALSTSIWGLIIGRLLQGAGAIASVLMALLADQTKDTVRTKAMAIIGMSIGASFFLAFILGPFLAQYYSLSGIFWITAILVIISLFILWFVVPTNPVNTPFANYFERLSLVLKDPFVLKLIIGVFFLHALITLLFVILPSLVIKQFFGSVNQLAWFYLPILTLSFVVAVPVMLLLERKGKTLLLLKAAQGILLAGMVGYSLFANTSVGLIAATFVFFVGFHMLEAMFPSLLSKQVGAQSRGAAMGIFSTCQFLGTFMGGFLGGISFSLWHEKGVFFLGAILVVICYIVFLTFQGKPKVAVVQNQPDTPDLF